jgi:hypothetical protein
MLSHRDSHWVGTQQEFMSTGNLFAKQYFLALQYLHWHISGPGTLAVFKLGARTPGHGYCYVG